MLVLIQNILWPCLSLDPLAGENMPRGVHVVNQRAESNTRFLTTVPQGLCTRPPELQVTGHLCKSGSLHGVSGRDKQSIAEVWATAAGGEVWWTRVGARGLTQHTELQVPGISASDAGGLTAVQPSIRGLDSSEVDRALRSLAPQSHPILEPAQLGFWVALGHTVQVKGFSRQHLQDSRAGLHLRGDWQGSKDE